MYACHNCERLIDEPRTYREQTGEYWGEPYYEEFVTCPYCGGELEEANRCDICGAETINSICEECSDRVREMADDVRELIRKYNLDENEFIQYLVDELEG